ncbi:ribosome recycling factor [Candidatus Gracilibacteria bacterium GN02-872]|nr:ribosome recycling factor [Candidatus Gracilibacteria bacterium GN02-872]RKW20896.1 MAG: ribosome recycling factor [Candidatus Gracilibacteria bacterium]
MLEKAKQGIEKALKHLDVEYAKLQLGRANPVMVEGILVEQYGSMQPIQNMASVSNLDSQTLSIKPWDRNAIHPIAKAITESGLGLNPQTMADSVLIKVPPLTEERRKEIAKVAKNMAEEAKVSVRNARQESLKDIKKAEDNKEISEDVKKDYETQLQKIIDEANKKIDEKLKLKEADIMKI